MNWPCGSKGLARAHAGNCKGLWPRLGQGHGSPTPHSPSPLMPLDTRRNLPCDGLPIHSGISGHRSPCGWHLQGSSIARPLDNYLSSASSAYRVALWVGFRRHMESEWKPYLAVTPYPSMDTMLYISVCATVKPFRVCCFTRVGLKVKAFMILVLRLSMVASMDVTSLLEGIDSSTPATNHAQRIHVVSPIALLPLGFCTQYLLLGAPHQRLALSSPKSLECFTSSYAGLWGP
jgi:hypothetical protein